MPVKASGRFSQSLLGSSRAAGGLLADAPIDLLHKRGWSTYFNDFQRLADFSVQAAGDSTNTDWTTTAIGTMTVGTVGIVTATENGVLAVIPDATDNEGYHVQYTSITGSGGELWRPKAGRTIVFEANIGAGDWDGQDYFIGLAETSATFMSAAGALTSDNFVGFHHLIADAGLIDCVAAGTADANEASAGYANSAIFTNSTVSTGALVNFHKVGFVINGTNQVDFYLNGQRVRRLTMATAFDDNMCITFANVGSGATSDTLWIDYILAAQTR